MKKIKVLVGILALVIVGVLGLAATQPDTFNVERTAVIPAAPAAVFAKIDDLHSWIDWSPFEKINPAMKRTYSGPTAGKGSIYSWDGNNKIGAGQMEIIDASPRKVTIKLDFIRPFVAHNIAEFTLVPQGASTRVTWSMHGPVNFVGKVIHLFMNMDTMVGGSFERGLANLGAELGR